MVHVDQMAKVKTNPKIFYEIIKHCDFLKGVC